LKQYESGHEEINIPKKQKKIDRIEVLKIKNLPEVLKASEIDKKSGNRR